jgi:hypothetical protein
MGPYVSCLVSSRCVNIEEYMFAFLSVLCRCVIYTFFYKVKQALNYEWVLQNYKCKFFAKLFPGKPLSVTAIRIHSGNHFGAKLKCIVVTRRQAWKTIYQMFRFGDCLETKFSKYMKYAVESVSQQMGKVRMVRNYKNPGFESRKIFECIAHTKKEFFRPQKYTIPLLDVLFLWCLLLLPTVARFFLVHATQTGKMYQMNKKYSEIPNVDKIFQMAIKYINIFQSEAIIIFPKLGFLVWKQTIWQP